MRPHISVTKGSDRGRRKVRDGTTQRSATSDSPPQLQSKQSQDLVALMSHYLCAAG